MPFTAMSLRNNFFSSSEPMLCLSLSSVDVRVKRLGGAYGAKITRGHQVAAACAIGAYTTGRWALICIHCINLHTPLEGGH